MIFCFFLLYFHSNFIKIDFINEGKNKDKCLKTHVMEYMVYLALYKHSKPCQLLLKFIFKRRHYFVEFLEFELIGKTAVQLIGIGKYYTVLGSLVNLGLNLAGARRLSKLHHLAGNLFSISWKAKSFIFGSWKLFLFK